MKDIERMVVSAYQDGEVEAPWRDRVAGRIASDAEWAAEAQRQSSVKAALAASPEPDFTAAMARVESRLGSPAAVRVRTWPLVLSSAAAAAVLVLAVGAGYWLGRQQPPAGVAVSELKVQVPQQLELKLSGEGQLLMASTLNGMGR